MDRGSGEARYLYVTGVGGLAFLLGLAPMVNLAFSLIGLMFAIAAFLGAVFLILIRLRQRKSTGFIILELCLVGLIPFVAVYGVMWYWLSYVPSQGTAFFNFNLVTPTPHR